MQPDCWCMQGGGGSFFSCCWRRRRRRRRLSCFVTPFSVTQPVVPSLPCRWITLWLCWNCNCGPFNRWNTLTGNLIRAAARHYVYLHTDNNGRDPRLGLVQKRMWLRTAGIHDWLGHVNRAAHVDISQWSRNWDLHQRWSVEITGNSASFRLS